MVKHFFISLFLIISLTTSVWAGSFDEGLAAYNRGDYETALRESKPLSKQGDAEAQFYLGLMYDNGQGVSQDYIAAMKWYKKAAERGYARAQYNLGVMYSEGDGAPKDNAKALKWFRKAAERGYARAQYNLGVIYSEGDGAPKDNAKALKLYHKAAEQGHLDAQFNLGLIYSKGESAPQDNAKALKWFRKAAEQGDVEAQTSIGTMYQDGEGTPKNYIEAYVWFELAKVQGDTKAKIFQDALVLRMSTKQLNEAQRFASDRLKKAETKGLLSDKKLTVEVKWDDIFSSCVKAIRNKNLNLSAREFMEKYPEMKVKSYEESATLKEKLSIISPLYIWVEYGFMQKIAVNEDIVYSKDLLFNDVSIWIDEVEYSDSLVNETIVEKAGIYFSNLFGLKTPKVKYYHPLEKEGPIIEMTTIKKNIFGIWTSEAIIHISHVPKREWWNGTQSGGRVVIKIDASDVSLFL